MKSYRESHLDAEIAENYESRFSAKVDSLIWDDFVKPWLERRLCAVREGGARSYLDFACGTGRVLKVGFRVFGGGTGIDVSERMVDFARQRVPEADFYCVDVTRKKDLDFGKFDCVTMFRFLLNAEPELCREVLEWIAAHMEPGATLVVNNHGHAASAFGLVQKLAFWIPRSERKYLSRKDVFRMLEGAGFFVESCDGYRILPSIGGRPVFGRRLQASLEKLSLGLGLGRFGSELVIVAKRV